MTEPLRQDAPMVPGLVSLIVTAKNEAEDIERCLRSLLDQTHAPVEVILVDNNSTDGTVDIARRLGVRVETRGPERSAQRNHGYRVSRGEFVCFLDADMEVPRVMAAECAALLRDPAVGAVVIPELSVGEGFWTACKILERSCYDPGDLVEAARFYRAGVVQELGGFDEMLTGLEDWDLSNRCAARHRLGHSATPIRHHEGVLTYTDQLRKKYYYGRRSAAYARKHPELFRRQGNPLRAGFFRNWRKLAARPGLAACMFFLKFSELAAGGFGVLAGLMNNRTRT